MLFLQVDTLAAGMEELPVEEVKESFFDIVLQGGWTMVPIFILFVLAIFIFIERYLNLRRANQDPAAFMQSVRSYVVSGNLDQARIFCQQENTPFSRMILKGLNRLGAPLRDIAAAIENVGSLEVYRLEKRLAVLATIAGAAPMLGFFGTVVGMIQGFMKIAKLQGNVNPSDLAAGIYTAMVTTAGGLLVGLIAYLGYNTLVNMVGSVIFKMETSSTDFIDILQEPVK